MPEKQPKFITSRTRFLRSCKCEAVDRPPIWMMRQAGRSLPEYRALKEGRRFTELVRDPLTAAKITLQPIRRFGYDAAVIFSDILVISEALGHPYELQEKGGVKIDFALNSAKDIQNLNTSDIAGRLSYTPEAIRHVRKEAGEDLAIIGFAGSPWTLASFMIEGGSSRENTRSRALFYNQPQLFNALMEKITEATRQYLLAQLDAGADVLQLFDSQGGTLPPQYYWEVSGRWMKQLIDSLPPSTPITIFTRNTATYWDHLIKTGASVIGIDWITPLQVARDQLPDTLAIQGNLDPALLQASPNIAAAQTNELLATMKGRNGYIFNLGHGVPPDAHIETITAIVETVKGAS